jgi:ABC-type microcin C transport system duplicated ATPase subunit YejF
MLSCLRLIPSPPGKIVSGQALFKGKDLITLDNEDIRKVRGGQISMVFQDPMTSLNPVMTIGKQMAEPLMLHLNMTKERHAIAQLNFWAWWGYQMQGSG